MGCAGVDVRDGGLKELDGQSLQNMDLDLKNSLILYLSPKIPKYIKIGIYVDTIYHKKKGLGKIIKYTKTKFFIQNESKKSFNSESILRQFLEKFPQFIKNDDISKNKNSVFSPNYILNNNYISLFKSLNINTNNKNNFAICFIDDKENDLNLISKLNALKDNFENNFFIYKIKNKLDVYSQNEQYTLFFRENKINFWVENDCYNNNNFNSLLKFNNLENNINNNLNNAVPILNNESIKNYLNTHSKKEDEYIIKNKFIEYYDKDGNRITFNDFPTFIIMPNPNQFFNEQIIFIASKQKVNIINYIINEIKKINSNVNIQKIEVFKERITSFILRNFFVSKKKYSLFFSSLENNILYDLIKEINEKINPNLKKINSNCSIENIIIMPEINTKFNLYEENKMVYIIINYSTCIKFVTNNLKEKYENIYGKEKIRIICIYREDSDELDLSDINNNDYLIFLDEKSILNENKIFNFYIYSFNPINYFSHILIIVNQEGNIQYTNYFKNRASIFYNYLNEQKLNIKQNLGLIDINNFKNVKNFFAKKIKSLLDNVQVDINENIIEFDDVNIFENYYRNGILYQPYLSLKYNKIINIMKKNEKNYRNYSLNYINFKNFMEIPFDEKEHKPLNEISHIYYEKDKYFSNKKEIRCKECFIKLTNKKKFIFYFCPISKDVICPDCYIKNENYEVNYPFNLLYINCKNKLILDSLPKDNILLFRDRIKYENHPEIMDELCDLCSEELCKNNDKGYGFSVLINIIRKNNFLICNNCFDLLNDEKRSWNYDYRYSFMNDLILNNFIDLDNLIFKQVKLN